MRGQSGQECGFMSRLLPTPSQVCLGQQDQQACEAKLLNASLVGQKNPRSCGLTSLKKPRLMMVV